MDYSIKIDVSHLVAKVKQHNLLFYPAMIHILVSALKRHINEMPENLVAVYTLTTPSGNNLQLWHEYHDNFLRFFEHYVRNCYQSMTEESNVEGECLPKSGILFSALPPSEKCLIDNIYPEFYLSAFEEEDGKIWQNVLIKAKEQFNNVELFKRSCQKMCDMFQERV